jgi:hypothetical protein
MLRGVARSSARCRPTYRRLCHGVAIVWSALIIDAAFRWGSIE